MVAAARASGAMRAETRRQGSLPGSASRPQFRQPKVFGRVGRQAPADPAPSHYRLICRPALAEIVGDGRPWTVLMISLLSMPWS
jgi:hypothetical protein